MSTNVTPIDRLDKARQGLSSGQQKVVRAVMYAAELEMIDALPELTDGVRSSARQGSWTVTLELRAVGKSEEHFKATLKPRVRVPKEPTEFDFHLGEDRQLELGLPPELQPSGS